MDEGGFGGGASMETGPVSGSGRLTDLIWVQMHGRVAEYIDADDVERPRIVDMCRRQGTVPDLPERILRRTIYAQSSTRIAPLRELLQNALDASPRGARIDVNAAEDGHELCVTDRGRGMSRRELLLDLLVP